MGRLAIWDNGDAEVATHTTQTFVVVHRYLPPLPTSHTHTQNTQRKEAACPATISTFHQCPRQTVPVISSSRVLNDSSNTLSTPRLARSPSSPSFALPLLQYTPLLCVCIRFGRTEIPDALNQTVILTSLRRHL